MSILRRRHGHPGEHRDQQVASTVDISAAPARRTCTVAGTVTRMRTRPSTGVPALAVTISDDTGSVMAVWTGRRAIGGVTLGRRMALTGVASRRGEHLEFHNPSYTLLP